jgi:hypothetical protein
MYSAGVAVFSPRDVDHPFKEPIRCFKSYHHHRLTEKPPSEETAVGRILALQFTLILCLVKAQVN